MIILDNDIFKSALKRSRYKNIKDLSHALNIHRNTIHYYLSGVPVIPLKLEQLLKEVDLMPLDALKDVTQNVQSHLKSIASLADNLHRQFPDMTVILFGSRASGCAQQYSDWDLGIYSGQGITHKDYQKALRLKSDFEDDSPYFIDLVNLNHVDQAFINNISKDWIFLTGSQTDWIDLNEKYKHGKN